MKSIILTCISLLALAAFGAAQEMPKPGPEHKKLEMFSGSWTLDGDLKAGPMGPGGKIVETEKCEWMDGGFFLVCHSQFTGAAFNGISTSYMGYSADDKTYTYREFSSTGEFTDSKGAFDTDTWTWTSDERMGSTVMKGRFIMKITSPTSYNFVFEMSPDGAKWTTVMDGKATKK